MEDEIDSPTERALRGTESAVRGKELMFEYPSGFSSLDLDLTLKSERLRTGGEEARGHLDQ